jgi:hypothetical protein
MCETNSFSGGGPPGISDTFMGALWTLDYMLLLAANGCSGVNMETGVNQLGFVSSYSPIQDDGKGVNTAGVPYYGMLAFATAQAGNHEIYPVDIDNTNLNLTAYTLGRSGKPRSVVIVNKDRNEDARFSLAELNMGNVIALRLAAPSPESMNAVTFGGASVDAEGRWSATTTEQVRNSKLEIPHMSAVVVCSTDHQGHT